MVQFIIFQRFCSLYSTVPFLSNRACCKSGGANKSRIWTHAFTVIYTDFLKSGHLTAPKTHYQNSTSNTEQYSLIEIYSTTDNRGEGFKLTVISSFLSGGGFTSGGGRGGVGIVGSILLGVNFKPCGGRGGRLSSLIM